MSKNSTTKLTRSLTTVVGSLVLCSAMTLCYADNTDNTDNVHTVKDMIAEKLAKQEATDDSHTDDSSSATSGHVKASDHDDVNPAPTTDASIDTSADGTDADNQDQEANEGRDDNDGNIFTIQDDEAASDDEGEDD